METKEYMLERQLLGSSFTEGIWLLGGKKFCDSLEDKVREVKGPDGQWIWKPEFKVKEQTAIPSGRYALTMDMSTRFKMLMPHVLDVPDFTGIRIHGGVDATNTEGCPMTGIRGLAGHLLQGAAWSRLFREQLAKDLKVYKVLLTVKNP